MNNIKLFFLTLITLWLWMSSSFAQEVGKKTLVQFNLEHSIYSYKYGSGDIILFHPRKGGLSSEFSPKGTSTKYLTTLQDNCVAINGFYFGQGIGGDKFQPAGPFTRYIGLNKSPIVMPSDTNPADDVNLQNEIFYNSLNNNISINKSISLARWISFYAGPLVMSGWIINPELNKKISHRSSKHYRTFIVQDDKNKATRGLTSEKISLPDLGNALQNIYKNKKISVVNLDGGSSTSFSSSKLSYNESKVLPSLFHSCK